MPANRMLHKRALAGDRTNALTHLEWRIWTVYEMAADDFGVMRCHEEAWITAHPCLGREKARAIRAAIEKVINSTLLGRFKSENGLTYVYQRDWQDWQSIEWPSITSLPRIPDEFLQHCSEPTQRLHQVWPGGAWCPPDPNKRRKRRADLPSTPVSDLGSTQPDSSGGVASSRERLTAHTETLSGSVSQKSDLGLIHQQRGAIPRYDPNVYRWGRVRVMVTQHAEFRQRLGGDDADARLEAFYDATEARWAASATVPPGSCFVVWQREFDAAFATPATGSSVADANRAAAEAFVKGGAR